MEKEIVENTFCDPGIKCNRITAKSYNQQQQNLIAEDSQHALHRKRMVLDCEEEGCSESKVVVQVLPSVDLGAISALADFSTLGVKSKGGQNMSCNLDSFRRKTFPSSSSGSSEESMDDVDDISDGRGISEFGQMYRSKNKQVSKRCLKKRKPSNHPVGIYSMHPGNGMKLLHIKHISSELTKSSAQVIRILHYLLFGIYGPIANDALLQQTRQNILQFSGFSFAEDSDMHTKKEKALLNLPYPLLVCIHKILIHSPPETRSSAVASLLQFLQKPTDAHFRNEMLDDPEKELSENEILKLKSNALEAHPVVLLKRLNGNFVEKMRPKVEEAEEERSLKDQPFTKKYVKPSFIRNGTGIHLKCFPEIVSHIEGARRRIVNLLHSLLYGRPGSDSINRQNILEFNGFASSQKNFVTRKMTFLKRLRAPELLQLCDVFSLRVKTANKNKKIIKLLQFLASPDELNPHKTRKKHMQMDDDVLSDDKPKEVGLNESDPNDTIGETIRDKPSVKLRDFDTICSKVECATPDSLSELNDLLFVKPCDISEIHQKILDFTSFSFNVNSFDFHCRKTLMRYMDMKAVRRIADLLNIESWENCRSHQDLSQNILNFLMNMQLPDKKKRPASHLKSKRVKYSPSIMKLYSCGVSPKSRSCSPENFDSTYASEEVNENDCDWNTQIPVTCYRNTHSRYHHHRNGSFFKQEHVLNDSTPLFEFIQHPTDKELHCQIDKIISTAPLSISLGNLVTEVFKRYPNFNLQYRVDFIRNKALEILQELRENIVVFPD